jgi:drug/metabolite transporter (DMT)-like permease
MSRRGFLLFMAIGLAWGVPYFFLAVAGKDFSTPSIIFSRVVIGAAILVPFAIKRGDFKAALKAWPWVLAFAAIEMIGPWFLLTEAERHVPSGLAGLMIATVPIFGMLIAYFFQGDKSVRHPKTLAGLAIGFAGVVLLVGIDSLTGTFEPIYLLMLVLAALGYAVAPAIANAKLKDVPSAGMMGLCLLMVAAFYAIPALSALPGEFAAGPSAESVWSLVGLGVISSAIAFVLFFDLVKEVGSARATLVTYPNTAWALLLGIVFLHEPITIGLLTGLPLVALGSYLAMRKHA